MNPFTWIRNQSLFNDRRAVWLLIVAVLLTLYVVVYSLMNIESRAFKVPIRYSGYFEGRLADRGEWYLLYALPLFAIMTLTINSILALKIHKIRPELSQTILTLHLVVAIFTILITQAILGLL